VLNWLNTAAALFGASGILLGAFGAHGLARLLPSADLSTWRTAVLYHLLHAVALLALALYQRYLLCLSIEPAALVKAQRAVRPVAVAFSLGILLFSGSLYALMLLDSQWASIFGPLTPVGGVVLVCGWLLLLRR